jgi:hypothetical protein
MATASTIELGEEEVLPLVDCTTVKTLVIKPEGQPASFRLSAPRHFVNLLYEINQRYKEFYHVTDFDIVF